MSLLLRCGSTHSLLPGYAIFEIPSNLIIRRVGARWWLSFLIIAWGACVLGMGFVHTWQLMTVLRALLGIFEAGRQCCPSGYDATLRLLTHHLQSFLDPSISSAAGTDSMRWHGRFQPSTWLLFLRPDSDLL